MPASDLAGASGAGLPALRAVLRGERPVSRGRYLALAALTSFVPAAALAAAFLALGRVLGDPASLAPVPGGLGAGEMLLAAAGYVIFAPVVETALLAGLVQLLRRATAKRGWLVGVPAVVFGALHGLTGETGFSQLASAVVTVWTFLVFSYVFAVWSREGFGAGYRMSLAVHALNNLAALVALAVLVL